MATIELLESVSALAAVEPEWQQLAGEALERNVFFEPCMLLPALRYLGDERPGILLIRRGRRPIGLFPVVRRETWHGMPLRHYALWRYRHCYLATPLVSAAYAREALEAFVTWIEQQSGILPVCDLEFISGGKFLELFEELYGRRLRVGTDYERTVFHRAGTFTSYWNSYNGRKRLQHKTNRLYRLGEVGFETLSDPEDVESWIGEFLHMEQAGWKGAEGTAMACRADDTAYFRAAVHESFARDQLLFQKLTLQGRPISMKCSFTTGPESFSLKIAYDESFKSVSPGLLLEIEVIRHLLDQQSRITLLDSCAAPGTLLFEGIYPDRRRIVTASFSNAVLTGAWKLRDAARSWTRRNVQRASGGVVSSGEVAA